MKNLLASLATVAGKPVATEEEGVVQMNALGQEVTSLRARVVTQEGVINSLNVITDELGEKDPAKAVDVVRSLKAENKRFSDDAVAQKKARIDGQIAQCRAKFEKKITPALFDNVIAKQLRVELESGTKPLEQTETYKQLAALRDNTITDQASSADDGSVKLGGDKDARLMRRVKELMQDSQEVKKLWDAKGEHAAYMRACEIAEEEEESAGATA